MRLLALIVGVVAVSLRISAQSVATAELHGTVVLQNGRPLENAYVTITREMPKATDITPPVLGTLTGKTGAFSFVGLMAGRYLFCAVADPDLELVEFCEWTINPPAAIVANGQVSKGFQLTMEAGVKLTVRAEDPFRLAARAPIAGTDFAKGPSGKFVQFGVLSDEGLLHSFRLESSDHTGVNYILIVPKKVGLKLHYGGAQVRFVDEGGTEIGKGASARNLDVINPLALKKTVVHLRP